MTNIGKWITTGDPTPSKSGKTKIWAISGHEGFVLGHVQWIARWRKYGFAPGRNTVYESDCLNDLANFCTDQTAAHKKARVDGRESS